MLRSEREKSPEFSLFYSCIKKVSTRMGISIFCHRFCVLVKDEKINKTKHIDVHKCIKKNLTFNDKSEN